MTANELTQEIGYNPAALDITRKSVVFPKKHVHTYRECHRSHWSFEITNKGALKYAASEDWNKNKLLHTLSMAFIFI